MKSMEEAIKWVKRCPIPIDQETEIEIRQVMALEDFGDAFNAFEVRVAGASACPLGGEGIAVARPSLHVRMEDG